MNSTKNQDLSFDFKSSTETDLLQDQMSKMTKQHKEEIQKHQAKIKET